MSEKVKPFFPSARRLFMAALTCLILAGVVLLIFSTPQPSAAGAPRADTLCGEGSAPDYGFRQDLQQEHWTVGWQGYVSEATVNEVDAVLDRLDQDSIAQTMIYFIPQSQVGNRVNCAVHFLRYMKLGLASGERKDNGFVFLIVVEPERIDVHYGVGLGLPALTANGLTSINRAGEEAYRNGADLDQALLTIVHQFAAYARSKYTPLASGGTDYNQTSAETVELPPLPEGPLGVLTICGLLCIGTLILLFVLWLLYQMARLGIRFPSSSGGGSSWGGSSWTRGGGGGGPRMRGGGGSGRSGRGN